MDFDCNCRISFKSQDLVLINKIKVDFEKLKVKKIMELFPVVKDVQQKNVYFEDGIFLMPMNEFNNEFTYCYDIYFDLEYPFNNEQLISIVESYVKQYDDQKHLKIKYEYDDIFNKKYGEYYYHDDIVEKKYLSEDFYTIERMLRNHDESEMRECLNNMKYRVIHKFN